jgi:hypothetical protein
MLLPEFGGGWTTPPPEEVQLDTPPTSIANTASATSTLRRFQSASGTTASPHASGSIGHADGRTSCAVVEVPVAISTVSLPVEPAATVSPAGLNLHEEYVGSDPHVSVNVPVEPLSGVIVNL